METNELKQDKQIVEVIEHRSVDTMRNAVISGQTRELLIMLAGMQYVNFVNHRPIGKIKYSLI